MTRVSGFMGGSDEVNDIVRKEMSGVGIWPWIGRKLKHCLGCLLGWLVMVAVIFGIGAAVVAKTGLINIPLLSVFYHEPQPVRLVIPAAAPLAETLQSQLGPVMRDLLRGIRPVESTFVFSESDLTRGLQDLAMAGVFEGIEITDVQVALLGGEAELFARFRRDERVTPLRFRLVPALERQPVPLRVSGAYIGEMPVWPRVIDALFGQAIKTQLGGAPFAEWITVKNFTVREGALEATVSISGDLRMLGGERP